MTRVHSVGGHNWAGGYGNGGNGHHGGGGGGDSSWYFNFGIGFGGGFSFGAGFGNCGNYLNFSFGTSLCHYEPWIYPGYCGYRPYWGWRSCYSYSPYWCYPSSWCSPWGGAYYSRCWPYYPRSYWYPGYACSTYYAGDWCGVVYERPVPAYLTSFSYCDTPCAAFTDCALISPSVVTYGSDVVWASDSPIIAAPTSPETNLAEPGLPAPATEAELAGTTHRELGDTYMKLGDVDSAARVYERQVAAHPGDVLAVRALGIAEILLGDTDAGTKRVERAYRIDPTLATRLFDRELLRNVDTLNSVLDRATVLAAQLDGRAGTGAAWLTVAVVMQADGRDEPAREALERASKAGLQGRVVEPFRAALTD